MPKDIPSNPDLVYKNKGWVSWPHWLGTSTSARGKFRPFKPARNFVRKLGLKGQSEWHKYCAGELPEKGRLPRDIPSNPHRVYKEWNGMGDWLGTGAVAPQDLQYLPFKQARKVVHGFDLNSYAEWKKFCSEGKLPQDVPRAPDQKYKDEGWDGWGDWLGTGTVPTRDRQYRPFKQARSFVRSLGLKNSSEWRKYCKGELPEKGRKPRDIPSDPHHVYKGKGWKDMGDWLGTGTVATRKRQFLPYKDACKFARKLGLESQSEWHKYFKDRKPQGIPSNPQRTYRNKGWKSWPDWLGTSK